MIRVLAICLVLLTMSSLNKINGQGMSQIGDAVEAYGPCDNGILFMSRIIGGPPSKENYWDGSFNVEKLFPNLTEARFTLKFNAAANVSVDPEQGRILKNKDGYHISYFKPDDGAYKRLNFKVIGRSFGKFPNVRFVSLNNLNVCENPRQWKPSILGAGNTASNFDDYIDEYDSLTEDKIQSPSNTATCGQRKVLHQGLITNGYPSNEGDWPWHVAIFHLEKTSFAYRCGGSILNTNTIITAAHCVIDGGRFIIPDRVLVKLGLHNRLVAGRNTQEFLVFKIYPHENFTFGNLQNDIALLKLSTEATFTNYVQPVCLWPADNISLQRVVNQTGYVIGWGLNADDNLSDILTQGTMPIVSQLTCLSSNRDFFGIFLSETNYCAGYRNGTSVCNGDSGGGMFLKQDNTYVLRGLVSLSVTRDNKDICNPQQFVIFTDVAKYLKWIVKYL